MQFPVPQFTDVEDRIFGPLTLKQFGIVFGAGVLVFLGFSVTKSILVAIFFFIVFGIPAIGLAFAKVNGRPIYNSIGYFVKFFASPKVLIFHKETSLKANAKIKDAEVMGKNEAPPPTAETTQTNLKEVQELLRKTASQESEIAQRMK